MLCSFQNTAIDFGEELLAIVFGHKNIKNYFSGGILVLLLVTYFFLDIFLSLNPHFLFMAVYKLSLAMFPQAYLIFFLNKTAWKNDTGDSKTSAIVDLKSH